MEKTKLIKKLERASRAVADPEYQSVFAVGKSQPIEHGQHIFVDVGPLSALFVGTVHLLMRDTQTTYLVGAPGLMSFALALYISAFEVGRAFEQIDSLERLAEMEDDRG